MISFVKELRERFDSTMCEIEKGFPNLATNSLPCFDVMATVALEQAIQRIWVLVSSNRRLAFQCKQFSSSFALSLSDEFLTAVTTHVDVFKGMLSQDGPVDRILSTHEQWKSHPKLYDVASVAWATWGQLTLPMSDMTAADRYGLQFEQIKADLKRIDDDLAGVIATHDIVFLNYVAGMKKAFENKELL